MISAREISDWRALAPWSTDLMVEQDYLICKAVTAIFEDRFLASHVAMRGGTVLHKGHLAPASRYSEDIDLVLVGDRPKGHIKRALNRVLHPLLGEPTEWNFTYRIWIRTIPQFACSPIAGDTWRIIIPDLNHITTRTNGSYAETAFGSNRGKNEPTREQRSWQGETLER